jgi:hypothetical protein
MVGESLAYLSETTMPFQTSWLNEPYIILSEYTGHVTGGDFDMNMIEFMGIIQETPLYILVDFSQADYVPARLFELSSPSLVINHANTRWFAAVHPSDTHSRTTRMLARDKVKLFNDRVAAVAFLRGMVRLDTGIILQDVTASAASEG